MPVPQPPDSGHPTRCPPAPTGGPVAGATPDQQRQAIDFDLSGLHVLRSSVACGVETTTQQHRWVRGHSTQFHITTHAVHRPVPMPHPSIPSLPQSTSTHLCKQKNILRGSSCKLRLRGPLQQRVQRRLQLRVLAQAVQLRGQELRHQADERRADGIGEGGGGGGCAPGREQPGTDTLRASAEITSAHMQPCLAPAYLPLA